MDMRYPANLPPENYRRIIDELSIVIADPALKLRFIKRALGAHQHIPSSYRIYPPLAEIAFRKNLLDRVEEICPGSKKTAKGLIRSGVISAPHPNLLRLYKLRHVIACVFLVVFVCGLSSAVASLFETVNTLLSLNEQQNPMPERIVVRKPIHYPDSADNSARPPNLAAIAPQLSENSPEQVVKYLTQPIWLVEKTPSCEIHSNRLQIFTAYTVPNIPRRYVQFNRAGQRFTEDTPVSNRIAGIVFHASESDLVPFKPEMNASIQEKSRSLIRFLQRQKSYNYIIDRFGRVYRLVREDHAAFHAGNSIWADDREIYLNLNHAFIGICFEGRDFEETEHQETTAGRNSQDILPRIRPTGISSLTEAQLRSGRELTDWLRVKYKIPQGNCVPHALTSINPDKKLIGYHLDLSRGFPFAKFSLSDKYREPLPSIVEFGFSYDDYFEKIFNGNIWPGIRSSEAILQQRARNACISLAEYRKLLNDRFLACTEVRTAPVERKGVLATARD